jgi:glycosyltransferase involved in cell wall biosynthesis
LGVPSDRPVLLFVGRIEPHKNPGEFVRVVAELARRGEDLHCVILGDAVDTGEFAASVQEEASQLAGRVTFVKRLAYEQMPDLYGAVAVSGGCLVSTSLHESQPMIVLEAMACGCPVVASDVGGLREILVDGQTGHLYPLGNVPCAADAVSRLMREKGHREAIVCAALDYVRRTHAPALVARTFVRLLDDIAALAATSDKAKQS